MRQRRTEGRIVGRDDAIARLIEHATEASVGAVLITGSTGVGKSRLAEAAMNELASAGWPGVGLSATDPAADIPFAALSELIPATLDELGALDAQAADLAVLRAVEDALGVDGERPTVIVIDEIAAFDEPSCNVLVHLAKNRRAFIIATQPSGPDVTVAMTRLTPAGVVELAIEPLSLPASAELAAQLLDGPVDPGLVREVWARSKGSPMIVKELITNGRSEGTIRSQAGVFQLSGALAVSPSMGRQILHRLGVLSGDERTALEILALGGDLDVDDLAGAVAEDVLDDLDRRGVITIRDVGGDLRATIDHPILAEAVAADMSTLARRRRHRELAELLGRRDPDAPGDVVLLALARLGSGHDVERDDLLDATRAALRADRIRDADQLAHAAFRSERDEATLAMFAETRIRQGRFIEADELLAAPLPPGTGDWDRMRRAIRRSSNQLWGFRDADAAWRIDDECRPALADPDAIDRLVAHQAWIAYCDGASRHALTITDDLVDNPHADVRFAVAAARAPALILAGRIDDGVALAQRAWDEGWGADTEYGSHGQHLIALGFGHLYLGELETARWMCGEAIRTCRERSETTALLFFLDLAAWTELFAGDLSAAASYFAEAAEIATELALSTSVRASLAGLAIAHAQHGRPDAATDAWHRVLDVPAAPSPRLDQDVGMAEAWHMASTGDPAKAADLLRAVAESMSDHALRTLEMICLLDIARLGYASARDAEQVSLLAESCQGPLVEHVAAAVIAAAGRDGPRLLAEATAMGERGLALWGAEFAALASDCAAGAGDRRIANEAQQLSDRLRSGLNDVQTPLLARRLSVEPLTRREREIAGRAATGSSNAEIAEQLHVSVRTVETHLQRAYRKLGVTSRGELAAVLAN